MNTGKHLRAAVFIAGMAWTTFLTGCGGGDDDGPVIVAPASLTARSFNFAESTGPQTAVSFTTDTGYTFRHANGDIEQGTYTAVRDGNTVTVTLISTGEGGGGQQLYGMTFIASANGTYILKREGEIDRTGTFSARSTAVSAGDASGSSSTTTGATSTGATTTGSTSTGSTTGSTSGTTTTGTTTSGASTTGTTGATTSGSTTTGGVTPSNQYTGFAPVSVAGRTMFATRVVTSTGPTGQRHTYTFSASNFHDSDPPEEADGTYTYSASNSSATMRMDYTAPADFVGDSHQWTLTYTAKDRGNFDSTYTRGDGVSITISGTFEYDPIP